MAASDRAGGPTSRPSPSLSGTPRRLPPGAFWLLLLVLAAVEVAGHAVIVARVPGDRDWEAAARYVRSHEQPRDLIEVAPRWADPLLREHIGDRISLSEAGRSDTAAYERLFVVSIRGAELGDGPETPPDEERLFGRVRVRRWDLGASPVLYELRDHVREADVELVQNGVDVPCRWLPRGRASGGGLGAGAMTPAERHLCDNARPWLWVGATVTEDLELNPRACIWQHPAGMEPVRATFRDVPLGDRLILYGGLYYEHERMREHGPVYVTVRVNGTDVGRMVHRDGDGWKRVELDPRSALPAGAPADARGDVSVEVMAPEPHLRTFCWSASTRSGPRRSGP